MKEKLFKKDFTLVVIGQIISLFGNAAVRFALPLYLLNETGSAALYGAVTACAFIPTILLSPVGGILADRINKRNIMVVLDFFTAVLILAVQILLGRIDLIALILVALMLLYGIAGAYQPAVQASVPALLSREYLMAGNSIINTISSFSALIGPILGGILYSAYGLKSVLWMCMVCFFVSAVMELFIRIPYEKREAEGSILQVAKEDVVTSIHYIRIEKPVIFRVLLIVCGINLFLSAMLCVGMPYLVTEVLPFPPVLANRLYGYTQGAFAAGGLAGGICAGIFAKKLKVQKAGILLKAATFCVLPMGLVLWLIPLAYVNYCVITLGCALIMVFSSMFTVQMMAFVQAETPEHLVGKVIAVMLTLSMCAQPLGNALYGILFEWWEGYEHMVVLLAGIVSLGIALRARNIFSIFENVNRG